MGGSLVWSMRAPWAVTAWPLGGQPPPSGRWMSPGTVESHLGGAGSPVWVRQGCSQQGGGIVASHGVGSVISTKECYRSG